MPMRQPGPSPGELFRARRTEAALDAWWRGRFIEASDLMVVLLACNVTDDFDQIRELVLEEARQALGPLPTSELNQVVMAVPVGEIEPTSMVRSAMLFRSALEKARLDFREPSIAERAMVVVQRRPEDVFADPTLLKPMHARLLKPR